MSRTQPTLAPERATGPIRVVRVDVDGPLPELSPFRGDGVPYVGAWVVAFRGGRPVGHVEVPFEGRVVSAVELGEVLVAGLGGGWSSGVAEPVVDEGLLPLVSVVVPSTFERVDLLERCVESLVAQSYPAFEVIVVDNRPVDSVERVELRGRLCGDSRVSVVVEPCPGISAARNRGVASAAGPVVAFIDDDVEVEPGWLRAVGARFVLEPSADCVTGPVLPKELETPAQVWFERSGGHMEQRYERVQFVNDGAWRGRFLGGLRRSRFQVTARRTGAPDETFLLYRSGKIGVGASLAVRTDVLRRVGGFDSALGAGTRTMSGEDHMLFVALLHAGCQITFDPGAYVFHTHRRTLPELRHQLLGYGTGYTAMLAASARRDRAHVAGLAWYFAQAVRLLARKFRGRWRAATRSVGDADPAVPAALAGAEFLGLVRGPLAFVASNRDARRAGRNVSSTPPEPAMAGAVPDAR